jgi:hypothetical protein
MEWQRLGPKKREKARTNTLDRAQKLNEIKGCI